MDAPALLPRRLTFKDPASAWTHFVAFFGALWGALFLLSQSAGSPAKFWAYAAYGIGFTGVFLSSSLYHFYDLGDRWNKWLRRLDHVAIFAMIAGSYIPVLMHFLTGGWRLGMLIAVSSIAILGTLLKLFWVEAPHAIGVTLYIAMGWMAVVAGPALYHTLPFDVFMWLAIGGIVYTVGAVVYALEWPNPWPVHFDAHAIWHLFVIGGAAAHFVAMVKILDYNILA